MTEHCSLPPFSELRRQLNSHKTNLRQRKLLISSQQLPKSRLWADPNLSPTSLRRMKTSTFRKSQNCSEIPWSVDLIPYLTSSKRMERIRSSTFRKSQNSSVIPWSSQQSSKSPKTWSQWTADPTLSLISSKKRMRSSTFRKSQSSLMSP